jgi:hypothetical protein
MNWERALMAYLSHYPGVLEEEMMKITKLLNNNIRPSTDILTEYPSIRCDPMH